MNKSILIVDDDSRNIFALSAILKVKGYHPISASGMEEAMVLLRGRSDIGLVLLDMMMPSMDGYEALPVLKNTEEWKHLPVIAVTAQAMTGDREKCIAAGADDYVSKPVDIDRLILLLKQYL